MYHDHHIIIMFVEIVLWNFAYVMWGRTYARNRRARDARSAATRQGDAAAAVTVAGTGVGVGLGSG